MAYLVLKYLHVVGATVLLGTGAGIAFFMLRAHQSGDARTIAAVARIVVLADFLFTATSKFGIFSYAITASMSPGFTPLRTSATMSPPSRPT